MCIRKAGMMDRRVLGSVQRIWFYKCEVDKDLGFFTYNLLLTLFFKTTFLVTYGILHIIYYIGNFLLWHFFIPACYILFKLTQCKKKNSRVLKVISESDISYFIARCLCPLDNGG